MLTISPSYISLIPYIQKTSLLHSLKLFFFYLLLFPSNSTFAKNISPYLKMTTELLPQKSIYLFYFLFSISVGLVGFPDIGKESSHNAGDPSSSSGSGRSTGEGIGYPLQYSWPSLVVQLVKNLPALRETWVQPHPLEEGMATHSSILAWRISWTEEPSGLPSEGWQKVR